MGQLKTEMLAQLKGYAPITKIMELYNEPKKFVEELNNYLMGGMVISSPHFFLMLKPIDRTKDPHGQWWVQDPNAWYVRWAAGDKAVKAMMDAVPPLPYLCFRRLTEGGETKLRTYNWQKFYKKVAR
tara:strand:+ start:65 stop:445 length:381 start_codon:yes stop_codon:yes gene_type:complete